MSGFMSTMRGLLSNVSKMFAAPQPPKMATPFTIPPPDEAPARVEAQWLAELRAFNTQFLSQMNELTVAAPALGAVGTKAIADYLSVAIPNLEEFAPKAEWLHRAGLDQMATGLDATLADAKKAYAIHLQTLGLWGQNAAVNAQITSDSDRATTTDILQADRDRQKAYQEANKNWNDQA